MPIFIDRGDGMGRPSFGVISMRRAAALYPACECNRDGRKHEHRRDHREGVAETHHQRLVLDRFAERDDGLLAGGRRIRLAC